MIAAAVGIAALVGLFPIRLFEIANPDWRPLGWIHAAIVVTLTLLITWSAGGKLWLGHFAPPILLILVAVPWISPVEVRIDHWRDLAGYGTGAVVFVCSLLFARLLGNKKVESRNSKAENGATVGRLRSEVAGRRLGICDFLMPTSYFVAALCWIVFVELATAAWYRAHERDLVKRARWEIDWPKEAENFHEIKIGDQMRRILHFDQGRAVSWTWPGFATLDLATSFTSRPPTCSLFFFRWKPGKNSALLSHLHRADVCLPGVGWEQVAASGVKNYLVTPELALPFLHFEFRNGTRANPYQQVAHAFYCLWEDRAPNVAMSQLQQMATSSSEGTGTERLRTVFEGRRHRGQQVMELVIQTRGALESEQVDARFAQILPGLIKAQVK